jgi:AAA+ ATPase superfamily predicted ATPase
VIDLQGLPNPYDFANPVLDRKLFIGRTKELEEVDYYLDHAARAARPINLAIIGSRASGKTSILNMIELASLAKNFCVVRIDLDEGDTVGDLAFFSKVFDGVVTAACSLGAFGGTGGRTYDAYP